MVVIEDTTTFHLAPYILLYLSFFVTIDPCAALCSANQSAPFSHAANAVHLVRIGILLFTQHLVAEQSAALLGFFPTHAPS